MRACTLYATVAAQTPSPVSRSMFLRAYWRLRDYVDEYLDLTAANLTNNTQISPETSSWGQFPPLGVRDVSRYPKLGLLENPHLHSHPTRPTSPLLGCRSMRYAIIVWVARPWLVTNDTTAHTVRSSRCGYLHPRAIIKENHRWEPSSDAAAPITILSPIFKSHSPPPMVRYLLGTPCPYRPIQPTPCFVRETCRMGISYTIRLPKDSSPVCSLIY